MSPKAATAADQLPEALVARILQHVPLQQRLASCALVCKAWAPAAAAATNKLSLTVRPPVGQVAATKGPAADLSSISITARQPEDAFLELWFHRLAAAARQQPEQPAAAMHQEWLGG
jgi:hypothetical protein